MKRAALLAAAAVALAPTVAHAADEQASDGTAFSDYGYSVGLSGTTGLIGAYGATVGSNQAQGVAYLYRNLDTATGTVTQVVKLTAPDGTPAAGFGSAVSLNASTGLVGAFGAAVGGDVSQGAAYLYRNLDTATGTVTQAAKLTASDGAADDDFGNAVGLSGSMGVVGAYGAAVGGNKDQGACYLFRNLDTVSGKVTQNAKLTASDGGAGDSFGCAVSLNGSTGLVGADGAALGGNQSQGAAYLFRNLNTATGTVTQTAKLTASDGAAASSFGSAVSLNGSTGLVGATGANSQQGAVYLFRNLDTATGTVTQAAKLAPTDAAAYSQFGSAVSESGSIGLVGARYATVGGNSEQGAAYLFSNLDTATGTVNQTVKLTASDGGEAQFFGCSVSLDGDLFVVGANGATGNAAASGKSYSGSVSSLTTLDTGGGMGVISGISFTSRVNWVVGGTTSGNQVTLGKGDTATVTAGVSGVFVGQTAGSNNNKLLVQGTVIATTVTIGAASGTTGNVLEIASDGTTAAGTVNASSGIKVNPGGTLLLSGLSSINDRIGNATHLTLAGGTFNLGGLSEGAAGTTGLGTLSTTAGSTLDFGTTGTANVVQFAGLGSHTVGQALKVIDWEGTPNVPAGRDRLLFAGLDSAFTAAYPQADVAFDGIGGYEVAQYSGYYEVYAAPEPTSLLLLTLGVAPALLRRRREP